MEQEKDISTEQGSFQLKIELAAMLKGGIIVDVANAEEARMVEDAGAVAVMALEKTAEKKAFVSRMPDAALIEAIQKAVSIPVMTMCRIGHFVEAQILETLFVDFIDESEVLTPADQENHIDKHNFRIPFVCGARSLGEALRRIGEGASMIRTYGQRGVGDIAEAVKNMRMIKREIKALTVMDQSELMAAAKRMGAPYQLVKIVSEKGNLPVPHFAAGGIATAADAALLMQLGAESLFISSTIFKSGDPIQQLKSIVGAVTHFNDSEMLAKVSLGITGSVKALEMPQKKKEELLAARGW